MKSYKYLDIATVTFVVVLLLSNFVANNKFAQISKFAFGSGIIFFPISYLLGDILTEVYGYAKSRRVIWIGFSAMLISTLAIQIVLCLPPAHDWPNQKAYETVFSNAPRTVFSSMLAFWAGEFANSFTLAKMKILTGGKYLWTRTIGSTVIGEAVDTLIFYPLAFGGLIAFPWHLIFSVMAANYTLKVLWEVIATPFTYKAVAFLKKQEHEDYYDYKTDFSPFAM
ncbi:MAG: queuosine precursor transporter [Candidatus Melainabacteria bacterium]|nr:queuosine precursor transporter [Candidatus Melainabacteria bacterium]